MGRQYDNVTRTAEYFSNSLFPCHEHARNDLLRRCSKHDARESGDPPSNSLSIREGGPALSTGPTLPNQPTARLAGGNVARDLIQREDYYPALVSFAFGFCAHIGVSGERHVDDAPFCRGHRFKAVLAPAGRYTPCCAARQPAQHLEAAFPVILDIDFDIRLAAQLAVGDHTDQELERLEGLAAPSYQQTCVLAFDLENQRTVVVVADICFGYDTHCAQEVIEEFRYELFGFLVPFPGNRRG